MADQAPPPEVFYREYVSLPENRLNVVLGGLMLITPFREWFLQQLGLPNACTVYAPAQTLAVRPDLVVVDRDDRIVAWIEVELGPEDRAQMENYRARFVEPVMSVVWREEHEGNLSLEAICTHLATRVGSFDPQQRKAVEAFVGAVGALERPAALFDYREPGDAVRQRPFIRALEHLLDGRVVFGTPPIAPGQVLVSTVTDKGWTVRVHSSVSGTVALFWDQGMGAGRIRMPSRTKLLRCLPAAKEPVEAYTDFIRALGVDMTLLGEYQNLPLPEDLLMEHVSQLALHIGALATTNGDLKPSRSLQVSEPD